MFGESISIPVSEVENSMEHAFDNKNNKQITITIKQTDKGVSIAYSDNGKLINSNIQDDVFAPFFLRVYKVAVTWV